MKFKKIIACLSAFTLIFGFLTLTDNSNKISDMSFSVSAATSGDLTYTAYDDHIEITTCDKAATRVEIPSEIDGLPVTFISDGAFFNCTELTDVIIPSSITDIGNAVFSGCTKLATVTFSEGLINIGHAAFSNCSGLKEIEIPETTQSIGMNCFASCTSLNSVKLNDGIATIGNTAFSNCTSLTTFSMPDSVTDMGASTFYGCTSLKSISISPKIKVIGNEAFENCSSLTTVVIPEGVEEIGTYAFHASALTSIVLPSTIKTISDFAFSSCSFLKSITIPKGVATIGDYSIGYNAATASSAIKVNGFTIFGYSDTSAEEYAVNCGITFVALTEATEPYAIYGDANEDEDVNVSDVVAVRRYLVNAEKYPLTAQGVINADVQGNRNGVNAQDAVAIQKNVLGIIAELPIK